MMKRLRRSEKEEIRNNYSDNVMYKALFAPCKRMESVKARFDISAEEVFLESISIVDNLKECERAEDAKFVVNGLWDTLYCDLRDLADDNVGDQAIRNSTCVVVAATVVLLSHCNNSIVDRVLIPLAAQCMNDADMYSDIQAALMANIWKLGEQGLKSYMDQYWDSDEYLSDTIRTQLAELAHDSASAESQNNQQPSQAKGLTNRQLIILFQHLLNVSFDSSTNISALAKLISKASGRKESSIRTQINEMKDIDYSDKNVAPDVEEVATLLMNISKDVKKNIAEPLLKMSKF